MFYYRKTHAVCTMRCINNQFRNKGFTLLELSIVLVIIGLIIGGVLIGQDLLLAAKARSAVSQMERYNASVNTFRQKYDWLPGDLLSTYAAKFGMATRSGAAGHGDGNGLIEGCSAGATVAGCEVLLFWADLSSAKLIETDFSQSALDDLKSLTYLEQNPAISLAWISPISEAHAMAPPAGVSKDLMIPQSKLANSNYVTAFSASGINYYQIAGITSTNASGVYVLSNKITPQQAFMIDSSIDDGLPGTGKIQAVEGTGPLNVLAVPGAATCVYNVGTPSTYNTSTRVLASSNLCQLRAEFQ